MDGFEGVEDSEELYQAFVASLGDPGRLDFANLLPDRYLEAAIEYLEARAAALRQSLQKGARHSARQAS